MARRVLVIHPGALGDVLLALPALAHLGSLLSGHSRVLVATPKVAELLRDSGHAEETIDLDALELHRLFAADSDETAMARLRAYDVLVSWLGAGDPTFRARLASLDRPVVIARAVPGPESPSHASRYLVETLAPLGPLPVALPRARLAPTPEEGAWARAWLSERRLEPGRSVLVHPGAGSPAKVWPGFPSLLERLAVSGRPVIVSLGPADPHREVVASIPGVHVAADLPLRRLAALLTLARCYVGNDSGPSHLAALVGCPTLVLFGPTDPALWAPMGDSVTVLRGAGVEAGDPWAGLSPDRVWAALG